jgi:hypothetical protein
MDEWVCIYEFPIYWVNDQGLIFNERTGRIVRTSKTTAGIIKVGLYDKGIQYTRAVSTIVADAFIVGRSEIDNTPMHLDGDRNNVSADNLRWRPRHFAWKYARQFLNPRVIYKELFVYEDDETQVYTIFDTARIYGLLFEDILRSAQTGKSVYPTHQTFKFQN